jgi:hypothetical protein
MKLVDNYRRTSIVMLLHEVFLKKLKVSIYSLIPGLSTAFFRQPT